MDLFISTAFWIIKLSLNNLIIWFNLLEVFILGLITLKITFELSFLSLSVVRVSHMIIVCLFFIKMNYVFFVLFNDLIRDTLAMYTIVWSKMSIGACWMISVVIAKFIIAGCYSTSRILHASYFKAHYRIKFSRHLH